MKAIFKTEQERFWSEEFGNEYIHRNNTCDLNAKKTAFFCQVFKKTNGVKTILEYGSNIGLNIIAIKQLIPNIELSAFAGEMLDKFKDLTLVDYGFNYHKDSSSLGDDSNWFLLEKAQ